MAKRVKGHRANKANDSFGTINNESLYRGKHREEVYRDDDDDDEAEEAMEAQHADPEEATPQESTSFVEQKQEADHDYKKRYDDLKKHYDAKVNEFKQEIADLKTAMQSPQAQMPEGVPMPKTPEELQAFKDQYPEVFEVVQTVSSLQAESQLSELREELGTIKEREKQLEKQKAYEELLRLHPDFDDIKGTKSSLSGSENSRSLSPTASTRTIRMHVGRHGYSICTKQIRAKQKRSVPSLKASAADAVTRAVHEKFVPQMRTKRFGRLLKSAR